MGEEKEEAPKKKGCLTGCLLVLVIIIVLAVVLAVFGYLNRQSILPYVSDKLGMEVSSVIHHVGTKAEKGMPSGFQDNAYNINLPQSDKTVRVTTSDEPAAQTYDKFIQYFTDEGWEVEKEVEALELAPDQLKSVSRYVEEELRAAELTKDGRKMGLAVTNYNDETVAAVWSDP